MLREVFNDLFQYASNIRGYGTRYTAKQLYKFGVQTNIGKQTLPFIVIDIWKDLPFSINSIKHFRSSQISQTLSTVNNRIKLFISEPRKTKQKISSSFLAEG